MIKKHFPPLLLIAFFMTMLSACRLVFGNMNLPDTVPGSGNVVTENREVSGFDSVTLQGMGEVIIDQNGSESLRITADENFLPYLETEVRGDTLFIRTTEEIIFTEVTDLTFHVTVSDLNAIELAGAGSFLVNDLDTDSWQVAVPGAGSITVSGRTAEQEVRLDGAGSYFAENLESQKATIVSNGAGRAVVNVRDELNVTINGLGSVEYLGDPQVTQEINGLGTVNKRS